jgi:hypothetical protein
LRQAFTSNEYLKMNSFPAKYIATCRFVVFVRRRTLKNCSSRCGQVKELRTSFFISLTPQLIAVLMMLHIKISNSFNDLPLLAIYYE